MKPEAWNLFAYASPGPHADAAQQEQRKIFCPGNASA